ncbi:Mbeg1-like protein [Clostridium sp.]|uniref:Mbeg1-like protein n=1 Tax=Clostridium sp. TaxID=1506 RepID=UPI002636E91C|nr:Mbeg1-like protein [Clostridium sp.]
MENIINYAEKELATLNEKEFNAIDSLILSQISNIILNNLVGCINSNREPVKFKDLLKAELFPRMFDKVPYEESTKQLLFSLAASPRFRDIGINYHISKTDPISEKQFSATTFILNNTYAYIAFRGTDYSVVGWKEDFNMAFTAPVPSQIEGVEYLNTIAKLIPHSLYVGGHSKGGNIAVYASMNCNYRIAPRIKKIFSHDGPGFREEIIKSDAFAKIKDKIHKTLPHSSFIGMLLENHEDYHVVKSNKFGGIRQHNPFSWEITNSDFNYLEKLSPGSRYTNATLHRWLSEVCDKKRKLFIETIFDIFDSTNSETFIEITQNWQKNIPIILNSLKNMDSEVKSMIIQLIKELSIIYIKNLTHTDKENISYFNKNFISNLSKKRANKILY